MRRSLISALILLLPALASAATFAPPTDRKSVRDEGLGKKAATRLDSSLAGDITRQKQEAPAGIPLQYDQFRLGVELEVTEKRHEQIESLRKIISYHPDEQEMPDLLFRLGELYWEESQAYFFQANRKDDDLITAMNRRDAAAQVRIKQEKQQLLAKRDQFARAAMDQLSEIVQHYKTYPRTDEVLYLLGHNLMEANDERRAMLAYGRLIEKYPNSKFVPDAYLAFGEYYFNTSKGRREMLDKALGYYKKAASYPENQVYGFALYKEGWCYFNLTDYAKAMDLWRTVILYGEFAGAAALEKDGGKGGKATLIREARNDYVRAYSRWGEPGEARATFSKVASKPDELFDMLKHLANLYYDDGKDREAALSYKMLIDERPLSPDAPGFQGKIVDCVLRAGNKKMTVQQVRRLVTIMQNVEKAGVAKTDQEKQALVKARDLAERTLSNLAVNWHNEAKKTRDDETFELANEVYADYLTLFPENPKAYDLRFFWAELLNDNLQRYDQAAAQYTKVVLQDAARIDGKKKPGKWLPNAAYDAVLAFDDVAKKAEERGELPAVDNSNLKKKLTVPPAKQAFLDACARYLKYLPRGEQRVEITFKAARVYYTYHHYDDAIARFSEIALEHPDYKFENGDKAGEISANLVLDSYNGLENYAKVNEWARRFYGIPKLANGQFKQDLSKIIEQSAFKLVNQLEEKKQFQLAAEQYLKFVKEFPATQIADTAIFNASTDFFKARMLDRAIDTRNRLIRQFPKSRFVPICLYANAEAYEAIGDFAQAADAYELYARDFERSVGAAAAAKPAKKGRRGRHRRHGELAQKDKKPDASPQVWEEAKAQTALFNAAIYRDGLGALKLSLKDRLKYLELWPDSKDSEAVFLSIADLYEKMGAYLREVGQLEEYERQYGRDPGKVLATEGRILALYQKHAPRKAPMILRRVMAFYGKLPHWQQRKLDPLALDPVARATLAKDEDQFAYYAHLKLHWGRGGGMLRDFKTSLRKKSDSFKEVERLYTEVVAMKAPDPAICALFKIGQGYQNLADSIANAPTPRGIPPDVADALKDQLSQQADPIRQKAGDAFAATVIKSRELGVYNDCSQRALKLLRDGLKPDQFPPMQEDLAAVPPIPVHAQLSSEGLLAALAPVYPNIDLLHPSAPTVALPASARRAPPAVPAASPAPRAAPPPVAADGREDTSHDLEPSMNPPPPAAAAPAQAQPAAAPSGQGSANDEPKDSL